MPPLNLVEILAKFSPWDDTIALWFDRDRKQAVLGLLPIATLTDASCYRQMEDFLGANPIATFLGGQAFDPSSRRSPEWAKFGTHHYFLPGLCFETNRGESTLTVTWPEDNAFEDKMHRAYDLLSTPLESNSFAPNSLKSCEERPPKDWCSTICEVLAKIKRGELAKVVLAKRKVWPIENRLSLVQSFCQQVDNTINSYGYYYQIDPENIFMSITPECLFIKDGNRIKTEALAGTRPRGKTSQEDLLLEDELVSSSKELKEHALVASYLKGKLEEWDILANDAPPNVLKLKHLQHLQTPLEGTLAEVKTLEEIIDHLHPTPAVAGWPLAPSYQIIAEAENFDRGFYAAPVGIVQKNWTHFAVAIRSALIHKNKLYLYGGVGIVGDSRAEEEWLEAEYKINSSLALFTNSPLSLV